MKSVNDSLKPLGPDMVSRVTVFLDERVYDATGLFFDHDPWNRINAAKALIESDLKVQAWNQS